MDVIDYNVSLEDRRLQARTIDVYRGVLNKGKRWPSGYWKDSRAKQKAILCMRYLCLDVYRMSINECVSRVNKSFLVKNKLGNMLNTVFNGNVNDALKVSIDGVGIALEERIKIQERLEEDKRLKELYDQKRSSVINKLYEDRYRMSWDSDLRKDNIKMVLESLNCDVKDIPKYITLTLIRDYDLEEFFESQYDSKFYKLLEDVYPGEFKPWQVACCGRSESMFIHFSSLSKYRYDSCYEIDEEYWAIEENRQEAIYWLLRKVLNKGKKARDISFSDFEEYCLESLVYYVNKSNRYSHNHRNNVFPLFNEFFPEKVRPWYFEEEASCEYWKDNKDIIPEAINYVFKKNNISKENIFDLSAKMFRDSYMSNLLHEYYHGYIYNVVEEVYPGEYSDRKWLFKDIPSDAFYKKKNRQEAVLFLLDYIGLSYDDAYKLKSSDFIDNNLGSLFNEVYNGDLYVLLDEVFPGKFKVNDSRISDRESFKASYEDSFGEYERLDICVGDKDNLEYIFNELSKLFKPNPNFWGGRGKSVPFRDFIDDQCRWFIDMMIEGNIKILKYKIDRSSTLQTIVDECDNYDEVDLVDDELDDIRRSKYLDKAWENYCKEYESVYGMEYTHKDSYSHKELYKELQDEQWSAIMDVANVKSDNLFELYATAHDFFIDRNININPTSIYMRLQKEVFVPRYYSIYGSRYEGVHSIDENTFPINKNHPLCHSKSLLRCGEVQMYRLLEEVRTSNADYVWAFPFRHDESINGPLNAYLIKFMPGVVKDMHDKMMMGVAKRVASSRSEFSI